MFIGRQQLLITEKVHTHILGFVDEKVHNLYINEISRYGYVIQYLSIRTVKAGMASPEA